MTLTIFDKTDLETLISNLRGEVGEIIETWTLYRELKNSSASLGTDDFRNDMKNQELLKAQILKKKLENEIITSLSELAERKYGQINFQFACNKLKKFKSECKEFKDYILENNFRENRNYFISHKTSPPTYEDFKLQHRIKYIVILKAIVKAIILMKLIDKESIGLESNSLWIATRRKRYDYTISGKAKHLMLPYIKS